MSNNESNDIQNLDQISTDQQKLVYSNGFAVGGTLSDFNFTLYWEGQFQERVYMSPITFKSFFKAINKIIEDFENMTRQNLLDMENVSDAVKNRK